MNKLIQKATEALRIQKFTEQTIRMSYLNYRKPFATEMEGDIFSREHVSAYTTRKYGTDIMEADKNALTKKQRRIRHAFHVLSEFYETGIIVSTSMKCTRIQQLLPPAEDKLLQQYLEFRQIQGDAASTLDNKHRTIHDYLTAVPIANTDKEEVLSYLEQLGGRVSNTSAAVKMMILKGFLSYCLQERILKEDFCILFLKRKKYEGLGIPSAFTPTELQVLISFMERSNAPNRKRNYAMAVLMMTYGFRAADILKMELSDINWEASAVTVMQSKTGNVLTLDLTPDSGNALLEYLLEERPKSANPRIFLKRSGQPITSASTISTVISTSFIDSGIEIGSRRHGSHSLRHSLAAALLENDTGIFEISRILGHTNVDTSRIYLKIDMKRLRMCGLEVPGNES